MAEHGLIAGALMSSPVRRLIKPTTPRTVHLLNLSSALDAPVQAEATTEADFVRLAALCPNVVHIAAQPESFELPTGRYTPDYRIDCVNGQRSYWEVKLESRIEKYGTTFAAMSAQALALNARFFVISDTSIRRRSQHKTAQLIHRYAKAQPTAKECELVVAEVLGAREGISTQRLLQRTSVARELVLHLLACRRLTFKSRVGIDSHDLLIHPSFLEDRDELLLARWLDVSTWKPNARTRSRAS